MINKNKSLLEIGPQLHNDQPPHNHHKQIKHSPGHPHHNHNHSNNNAASPQHNNTVVPYRHNNSNMLFSQDNNNNEDILQHSNNKMTSQNHNFTQNQNNDPMLTAHPGDYLQVIFTMVTKDNLAHTQTTKTIITTAVSAEAHPHSGHSIDIHP